MESEGLASCIAVPAAPARDRRPIWSLCGCTTCQRPCRRRRRRVVAGRPPTRRCAMRALLIGYARCSTDQQDLTAQREGLTALGAAVTRIYVDPGLTGTNPWATRGISPPPRRRHAGSDQARSTRAPDRGAGYAATQPRKMTSPLPRGARLRSHEARPARGNVAAPIKPHLNPRFTTPNARLPIRLIQDQNSDQRRHNCTGHQRRRCRSAC